MVAIYPVGSPIILLVMLWKERDRLYPPTLCEAGTEVLEEQVIKERRASGVVEDAPICEFAMIYKPRYVPNCVCDRLYLVTSHFNHSIKS